jgi:hypothetical protein
MSCRTHSLGKPSRRVDRPMIAWGGRHDLRQDNALCIGWKFKAGAKGTPQQEHEHRKTQVAPHRPKARLSQSVTDVLDPVRSNALSVALGGEGDRKTGDTMPCCTIGCISGT